MVNGPLLTGGLTRRASQTWRSAQPALVVPWFPWPQLFRRGPTATATSPDGSGGLVAVEPDLRASGVWAATRPGREGS